MRRLRNPDPESLHHNLPVAHLSNSPESSPPSPKPGFRLVAWDSPHVCSTTPDMADCSPIPHPHRTVTYCRELRVSEGEQSLPVGIEEYPQGPASTALSQLGLAASTYSHLRNHSYFHPKLIERVYLSYTDCSARREVADAVYVSVRATDAALLGMVTVHRGSNAGRVGLICVDETARGRGIGLALLRAAIRHLARFGCKVARVTASLSNAAACGLFEKAGFRVECIRNLSRFWSQAG